MLLSFILMICFVSPFLELSWFLSYDLQKHWCHSEAYTFRVDLSSQYHSPTETHLNFDVIRVTPTHLYSPTHFLTLTINAFVYIYIYIFIYIHLCVC
ncbi:hypothetical protein CLU79DRAFT_751420 [Phycomyces nitens]|nr:hypothetical protein CLU79DRAFT_751420 [Phycomyces nitens]